MSEEREQSPHYIPELDPVRTGDVGGKLHRVFWFFILAGVVMAFASVPLFLAGHTNLAIAFVIVGLILALGPFVA